MQLCKKCGQEIEHGAAFCQHCGKKQTEDANKIRNKKWFYMAGLVVTLLVIGLYTYLSLYNTISQFGRLIGDEKYAQAATLFDEEIKADDDKEEQAKEVLLKKLDQIADDYKNKQINHYKATEMFDNLKKYSIIREELEQAKAETSSLHDSREAFKLAKEYAKNKDWASALAELDKMSKTDADYKNAQSLKEEYKAQLKKVNVSKANKAYENNDLSKAVQLMEELVRYFPDEAGFKVKEEKWQEEMDEANKQSKQKEIETMISNQELVAVNTSIIEDWLTGANAQVLVQNKTNKVVKKYEVGIMAYDNNGYPVQIGWLNESYELNGEGEANIQPGETFGHNQGWSLDNDKAKTIISCVKSAEYYDGTTWNNPYYDVWRQEHFQVPLK